MKYRPRIFYTETDKALMWDRWQKGDSLHAIARLFDRGHGSIARILSRTGGIRPAKRTRSHRTISLAEREDISRGGSVVAGLELAAIDGYEHLRKQIELAAQHHKRNSRHPYTVSNSRHPYTGKSHTLLVNLDG